MEIKIQATERNLTPEEIKKILPPGKLESLAGKGSLKAYVLAHEGTSRPRVIGEGNKILRWTKKVINQVADVVKPGIKFFARHNADNSTDGRKAVGEVIATATKEIKGKLSNIVIGHFPNKLEADNYDVVSMEAGISVNSQDQEYVDAIGEISGIAVSSSKVDSPAFPGAVELAQIQCFDEDDKAKNKNSGDGKEMTFEDVKNFVKEKLVYPHQLFTEEDLRDDRKFGKLLAEQEELRKANEDLKKVNEELSNSSKDLIKKDQITQGKKKLDELLKEGYTDKQVKFIKKNFNGDNFDEITDETIKRYVDDSAKEFSELAKMFGADGENLEDGDKSGDGNTTTDKDPVQSALEEMEE